MASSRRARMLTINREINFAKSNSAAYHRIKNRLDTKINGPLANIGDEKLDNIHTRY